MAVFPAALSIFSESYIARVVCLAQNSTKRFVQENFSENHEVGNEISWGGSWGINWISQVEKNPENLPVKGKFLHTRKGAFSTIKIELPETLRVFFRSVLKKPTGPATDSVSEPGCFWIVQIDILHSTATHVVVSEGDNIIIRIDIIIVHSYSVFNHYSRYYCTVFFVIIGITVLIIKYLHYQDYRYHHYFTIPWYYRCYYL